MKAGDSEPEDLSGDTARIDDDARVTLPKALLRHLGWLEPPTKWRLIAELVEAGRVRLHRESDLAPRLTAHRKVLEQDDSKSDEAIDRRAAFADRYRKLAFYPKEGRVRITDAVAAFLSADAGEGTVVYIELHGNSIDVMSLDYRNNRLRVLRRFIGHSALPE